MKIIGGGLSASGVVLKSVTWLCIILGILLLVIRASIEFKVTEQVVCVAEDSKLKQCVGVRWE